MNNLGASAGVLGGLKALRFASTPLTRGAFGGLDPACARLAFCAYALQGMVPCNASGMATDTEQPVTTP